jgi:glycosyltransferase involved in cell wall biosynthesis/predicted ATP-grasp superfamily ATP-dependent carboligase
MPKVSAIIPTYNCANYICDAINSVLEQTYQDIEVIVVDDGSTDNTKNILEKYDSKIKYIYQQNSGVANARIRGLNESEGEYIALIDSDDIWLPEKLDKQVKFIKLCPELDIIFSDFNNFNYSGLFKKSYFNDNAPFRNIPRDAVFEVRRHYKKIVKDISYYYLRGNFILPSTMLIKKSACNEFNILKSEYNPREMYAFFSMNINRTKLGFIDDILTYRRLHKNNITYAKIKKFYTHTIEICGSAIKYPWIDSRSRKFLKNEIKRSYLRIAVYNILKGNLSDAKASLRYASNSLTYFLPAKLILILVSVIPADLIFFVKRIKKLFWPQSERNNECKIKLFILADTLEAYCGSPIGGAEKQILTFCQKIDRNKFDLTVGCLCDQGRLLDEIAKYGINTMRFGLKRVYDFKGILQGIWFSRFLKKENIDIVMTYHFGADIWGSVFAKLGGIPIILSNRRDAGFWRKPIHNIAYRLISRWVNKIIVVSSAVKKMAMEQENVSSDKVELIYNGIDLSKYAVTVDKDSKIEELRLPSQAIIIGCVGNIRPIKGHTHLIEASRRVVDLFPNAHFLFIGKDKAKGSISREIAHFGLNKNIHLLGIRNDIPELLAICDICVLPSLSEGFSNALLEYMVAGKPIVATDAGGNPDLIQDRINGLLAKKADSGDLAEKIIYLLENRGEAICLASKAKEDAKDKFSIDIMVKKYENLFERLLRRYPACRQADVPRNDNVIPAVVLGLSANGLSIIRSLGRKGVPVIGISASRNEPASRSKFLKSYFIAPFPILEQREFLNFLITFGKKLNRKAVLFATADEYIEVISKYRETLSEYYNFLLPAKELVEALLDKKGAYELTRDLGLAYPKTYFVNNEDELKAISEKIGYPSILKPRFSHLWREKYTETKVSTANSQDELLENFRAIKEDCLEVSAQEIIPGPDSNVYEFMAYLDKHSKPLAYFTCRKIRQYPPNFGIGCFSESKRHPKVTELGLDFLKKIGHKGLVHIEFKIDSRTNEPVFIEANLRTSFIGELSIASGIDLPYIAYKNLARRGADERPTPISEFQEGVKLLNFELDLGSFYRRWKNKELKLLSWMKSFQGKRLAHSYFSLDDTMPFLFVYIGFIKTLSRKVKSAFLNHNKAPAADYNRDKINILHLISSNGLYGAERVMLEIAHAGNYNGTKAWIGALKNLYNPHIEIIEEAQKNHLPAYVFESKRRFDLRVVSRVYDFIKKNDINIIHTHNYKANLLGWLAARKAKIPIIATLHGYIGNGSKLKLYERLDRFILRYFNKVILVDNTLRKWFKGRAVDYEVVNNGININQAQDHNVTRPPEKREMGIREGDLVIGTVGRLSGEKGHKFLIEAFAKISKEYPDARLLIIGDGELKKDLEDLSAVLAVKEKVTFTGFQKDVSRYYSLMDIYVSPSLVEHFPLSILEAMSFKKAIIATDVGATKELIRHRNAGLLISPRSTDEIYKAILTYIHLPDLRKTYGKNAQDFMKDNYSLQKMINSYQRIYQNVICG